TCKHGRAWNPAAAGDHEDGPALLLVAVRRELRQGRPGQQVGVQEGDSHRAATGASGAEVTAAPVSRRGAVKLYRTSSIRAPSAARRYSVTPQFATSPRASIASTSASSSCSSR